MTKQEEIREGVTELIRLAILNKDLPVRPAKEVLNYLAGYAAAEPLTKEDLKW